MGCQGITWEGFDGAENIEEITDHFVRWADLTVPQWFGHKHDWVMSLEVLSLPLFILQRWNVISANFHVLSTDKLCTAQLWALAHAAFTVSVST